MRQGKQYALRIDGLEAPNPQFRTNPLMRPITVDMIARIKIESPRFSKMISEKVGSNLGSSAITYLCFVYNILDDFGYHHFEAEEGKTMPLNPTSFSKIFHLRRATLQHELNPIYRCRAKREADERKKKYATHDTSYRCIKLDDYDIKAEEHKNDSGDLKDSINKLKPIYNDIIDSIIVI
jgi:hypothetical protein